jgi:hypothetical protein
LPSRSSLVIKRGDVVTGLRALRDGFNELGEARFAALRLVAFEIAESLGRAGQIAAGLATIDKAIDHSERTEERWHRLPDAPGGDCADRHAFKIVTAGGAVGDVPAAVDHQFVGGNVVAHQPEDHRHDVLGHADAVAVGDLGDGDPVRNRCLQIDMIGADARGDRELQFRRLSDPLRAQIGRSEWL